MKTVYRLDEDDVRTILAKHFDVAEDDVDILCGMKTVGYYLNEHEVPYLKVEVTLYKEGE